MCQYVSIIFPGNSHLSISLPLVQQKSSAGSGWIWPRSPEPPGHLRLFPQGGPKTGREGRNVDLRVVHIKLVFDYLNGIFTS